MSSFYLPPYLAHALIEGGTIVLDLRSGEFLFFDEVASAFWTSLLDPNLSDGDRQQILLRQFDAAPLDLIADFDTFRFDCLARGLLLLASAPPQRPRHKAPAPVLVPVWSAWRSLVFVAGSLRRSGFAATYASIVELSPRPTACHDVDRAERAFAAAENFFVSRSAPNDCLPRSLALFGFLRAMGVPATHRIGLDRYSLSAHAWVECEGRVILDADRRETLIPLTRGPV